MFQHLAVLTWPVRQLASAIRLWRRQIAYVA
jgi:hypothetical protein